MLPILSLLIGLSAALAAREQIRHGDPIWRGAHLPGVALTVGAAVVPLGVYLFLTHPHWSTLYWCAPLEVSGWHLTWILPGAPLAGGLGFLLGALLIRRWRPAAASGACALAAAGLITAFALVADRMGRLAEGGDWQQAPGALSGDLAAVFAFAVPVLLGAWAFLLVLFAIEGRKLYRASRARREVAPLDPAVLIPPAGLSALSGPEASGAEASGAEASGAEAAGAEVAGAEASGSAAEKGAPRSGPVAAGDEET